MTSPAIAEFWRLFEARHAELAQAGSADAAVYDALLAALQRVHPGLFLEFATAPGDCELVVTAEGDRSLFPLVAEVVAAAPAVPGWSVLELKPRLGFPATVRWEGVTVEVGRLAFDPLERAGTAGLGLRVLVPGLDPEQADDALNAVLRALDHGLGERRFAEEVAHVEVRLLPPGDEPGEHLRLEELEAYLDWRRTRRS
jgi:hypothetical protein